MSKRKCVVCGADPARGFASIYANGVERWYCHDDNGQTCYTTQMIETDFNALLVAAMSKPLDFAPMVSKRTGSRHERQVDCPGPYCRFEPREGCETDLSRYPVHVELFDDESDEA